MNKQVFDYFEDLDKKKLIKNKKHFIFEDDRVVTTVTLDKHGNPKSSLTIDEIPYFVKSNNFEYSIIDIASSAMYNNIGITNPPIYIFSHQPVESQNSPLGHTVTQDVNSVKNKLFVVADKLLSQEDIKSLRIDCSNKWAPLYNSNFQKIFLKYMTKECFDQLIGLFLVDELRSEQDRHENNYFFYKTTGAEKFEGVMPIDHEYASILLHNVQNKNDFFSFLYSNYHTPTILGNIDNGCYKKRINDIKELLQDQVLSQTQIELLKRALNYNFPKEVKNASKQLYNNNGIIKLRDFSKNRYIRSTSQQACDSIARLWEYNQKELGSDLEL